MLLIVGDTWCAVTDPLRYHSRISEPKAWIMIAFSWSLSIVFGIASAFRRDLYRNRPHTRAAATSFSGESVGEAAQRLNDALAQSPPFVSEPSAWETFEEMYDTGYSCVYFVVIILLPICLVCAMYWKIVTEAKQNGLRMRQNGSSPLLQSALNLAATSAATASSTPRNSASSNASRESQLVTNAGGLIMNIDRNLQHPETNQPLLTPVHNRRYLEIPKTSDTATNNVPQCPMSRSKMTRNLSARHLLLTEQADAQMRQVRSTPNLHKALLPQPDVIPSQHLSHCITVQAPIKALSYMTSIRHRLSNASSIFKYREESRAARISILVVIMFLVSYLPYGILVLIEGRHMTFVSNAQLLAILFVMISNISSPFIFAYRNKRVRRGVCRIFGLDAKTNERLQKRRIGKKHVSASSAAAFVHHSNSRASINSNKYLSPHHCQKSAMVGGGSFILDPSQHTQQTRVMPPLPPSSSHVEDMTHKLSLIQRLYNTSRRLSCASSACSSTYSESSRESSDV